MGKHKRPFRVGIDVTKEECSTIQNPMISLSSPVKYVKSGFGPGQVGRFIYGFGSLICFSFFYASLKQGFPPFPVAIIILLFLALLTFVTGRIVENKFKKENQGKRDKRSALILSQAKHGIVGHYSLYLRGFETTDKMRRKDDKMDRVGAPGGAFDPRSQDEIDFETEIAEAVEDEIPLVALGRPGEHIGAGRIASANEHWQEKIRILATKALIIFVLPYKSSGTQWEIEWILNNGRLSHSIFILPPKSGKEGSIDWEEIWNQLKPLMAEMKLTLPSYDERGMFFMFSKSGEVSKVVGFPWPPLLNAEFLREVLKELLSEISF